MVRFATGVGELMQKMLFSPETSGGLLAAVTSGKAASCLAALQAREHRP